MTQKRVNKYLYLWTVQGRYSRHGWEDVCAEERYGEGRARLKEYNDNEPYYAHRLVHKREPNPEYHSDGAQ